MARRKSKRLARGEQNETELAAAIGVTVERYRRDEWHRETPNVEAGAKVTHPFRRRSRVARFLKYGWIDETGAASLAMYEVLVESAGYDHSRSCLDMTPVGHGEGGAPPHVCRAREALGRARGAVQDQAALCVVHELLFSQEPIEDASIGLIAGGREVRIAASKSMVRIVADCLSAQFSSRPIAFAA